MMKMVILQLYSILQFNCIMAAFPPIRSANSEDELFLNDNVSSERQGGTGHIISARNPDLVDSLELFKNILDVNLGDLKTEVIQKQDILKKMIKSVVIIKVRNKGNRTMHNFNEDMLHNLYKQIHVDQVRKLMSILDIWYK